MKNSKITPRLQLLMIRICWGSLILFLVFRFVKNRQVSLGLNLLHVSLPFGMFGILFSKQSRSRWFFAGIMLGLALASLFVDFYPQ